MPLCTQKTISFPFWAYLLNIPRNRASHFIDLYVLLALDITGAGAAMKKEPFEIAGAIIWYTLPKGIT